MKAIDRSRAKFLAGALIVLLFIMSGAVFERWRYGIPASRVPVDTQRSWISRVENDMGLRLPDDSVVLVGADLPTDRSLGFYYWVVFTASRMKLPSEHFVYYPKLDDQVSVMEREIAPFKVANPRNGGFWSWENGGADVRITVLGGDQGTFLLIETFRLPEWTRE